MIASVPADTDHVTAPVPADTDHVTAPVPVVTDHVIASDPPVQTTLLPEIDRTNDQVCVDHLTASIPVDSDVCSPARRPGIGIDWP